MWRWGDGGCFHCVGRVPSSSSSSSLQSSRVGKWRVPWQKPHNNPPSQCSLLAVCIIVSKHIQIAQQPPPPSYLPTYTLSLSSSRRRRRKRRRTKKSLFSMCVCFWLLMRQQLLAPHPSLPPYWISRSLTIFFPSLSLPFHYHYIPPPSPLWSFILKEYYVDGETALRGYILALLLVLVLGYLQSNTVPYRRWRSSAMYTLSRRGISWK